jgi:UDP-N-acetylmuramate dehydrogenase
MTMQKTSSKKTLPEISFHTLKGKFTANAAMKRYTTIKIGGCARGVYVPKDTEDLRKFLLLCRMKKISLMPLGNGSNIIISDSGLRYIFLKLASPYFKSIVFTGASIVCASGVTLNRLCDFAQQHCLEGAEFLTGIPATVGGAVYQNAGAFSQSISGILKRIMCMDRSGKTIQLDAKNCDFKYRVSGLRDKIILSAEFKLKKSKAALIRKKANNYLAYRLSVQDYQHPSAGCAFKNPGKKNLSAGELIENCGLKGKSINHASVSQKHANFIINKGSATAGDVEKLMRFICREVESRYGIMLEREIEFIR